MKRKVLLRHGLTLVALCLVWQAASLVVGPFLLPSPGETFSLFFRLSVRLPFGKTWA